MKMITAVIKPYKLDDVREALNALNIHGMTVQEVRGYGRQKGHTELYRGAEYEIAFQPKIRIEIAVATQQLDSALDAISTAAHSGKIGDGKIFVSTLENVIRIRTGESGEDAL